MDDEDGNALAGSTDPALIKLREGMRYIEYEVIPEVIESNRQLFFISCK